MSTGPSSGSREAPSERSDRRGARRAYSVIGQRMEAEIRRYLIVMGVFSLVSAACGGAGVEASTGGTEVPVTTLATAATTTLQSSVETTTTVDPTTTITSPPTTRPPTTTTVPPTTTAAPAAPTTAPETPTTITAPVATTVPPPTATTPPPTTTTPPPPTTSTPAGPVTTDVSTGEDFFSPNSVVISVGDRVRWVNKGEVVHTTTSGTRPIGNGLWNEVLNPGASYTRTFDTPGTFTYFCVIHVGQSGKVTVNP